MKIDYYGLRVEHYGTPPAPDLEHELVKADAVARAKCGQTVLVKVWLRTDGRADLERLEAAIAEAVKPLGLR